MSRRFRRGGAGFTLIELVTVMMIVGILAVAVLPRFNNDVFDQRGFRDGVLAATQHARKMAIAGRRFVCVTVTPGMGAAGILAIGRDTTLPEAVATVACGTALALPAPGRGCAASNQVCAPNNVALGGSSVIFDPLGRSVTAARAVQGAALSITVSGQDDITVQPETGFVR